MSGRLVQTLDLSVPAVFCLHRLPKLCCQSKCPHQLNSVSLALHCCTAPSTLGALLICTTTRYVAAQTSVSGTNSASETPCSPRHAWQCYNAQVHALGRVWNSTCQAAPLPVVLLQALVSLTLVHCLCNRCYCSLDFSLLTTILQTTLFCSQHSIKRPSSA